MGTREKTMYDYVGDSTKIGTGAVFDDPYNEKKRRCTDLGQVAWL